MSINLLPWREALYKKSKRRLWIEGSVSLILVFVAFYMIQTRSQMTIETQEKKHAQLESELNALSASYELALSEKNRRDKASKKENFLKTKSQSNQRLFQFIEQSSDQMSRAMYLTEIKREEDKIYFFGKSASHAEISNFLTATTALIKKQPVRAETSQADGQNGEITFEVGYAF